MVEACHAKTFPEENDVSDVLFWYLAISQFEPN